MRARGPEMEREINQETTNDTERAMRPARARRGMRSSHADESSERGTATTAVYSGAAKSPASGGGAVCRGAKSVRSAPSPS
jgi:hypothetical protein